MTVAVPTLPTTTALPWFAISAASLGVDVSRTRIMVVIGVALGVGAAVAVAGAVGFVGLVAPHLVRRAVGSDPARIMLPAALAGSALVLVADIAIRLGPSAVEIKLGVVTALIGVPIFLSMIFRERRLPQFFQHQIDGFAAGCGRRHQQRKRDTRKPETLHGNAPCVHPVLTLLMQQGTVGVVNCLVGNAENTGKR